MYILRPMKVGDIQQIHAIESRSFPLPWSPLTYIYEINQNRDAYMGVVELVDPEPSSNGSNGRFGFLRRPFRSIQQQSIIVAYGGMWVKNGEAHISTIASHPDYRGHKLGELMLVGLVARGLAVRANRIVLEVRVSNKVAQTLYLKYGFAIKNVVEHYYRDNDEDAYYMMIEPVDVIYRLHFKANLVALRQKLDFRDEFTRLRLEHY